MRVISGKLKGRNLKGYDIDGTRPTMARVKESVFASIQDKVSGSVVLDLFAGSGNLGIEAISNGASRCFFVDSNRECIKVINENVKMFHIEKECVVLEKDYHDALNYFNKNDIQFDIIFIDPPYKYVVMNEILGIIMEYSLLKENGIIVFEYQKEEQVDASISLELVRNKKYGDKFVSIFSLIK